MTQGRIGLSGSMDFVSDEAGPMVMHASPKAMVTRVMTKRVPRMSLRRPTRVRGSEAQKVAIMYAALNLEREMLRSSRMASEKVPTTKDWPGDVAMVEIVVMKSMTQP